MPDSSLVKEHFVAPEIIRNAHATAHNFLGAFIAQNTDLGAALVLTQDFVTPIVKSEPLPNLPKITSELVNRTALNARMEYGEVRLLDEKSYEYDLAKDALTQYNLEHSGEQIESLPMLMVRVNAPETHYFHDVDVLMLGTQMLENLEPKEISALFVHELRHKWQVRNEGTMIFSANDKDYQYLAVRDAMFEICQKAGLSENNIEQTLNAIDTNNYTAFPAMNSDLSLCGDKMEQFMGAREKRIHAEGRAYDNYSLLRERDADAAANKVMPINNAHAVMAIHQQKADLNGVSLFQTLSDVSPGYDSGLKRIQDAGCDVEGNMLVCPAVTPLQAFDNDVQER